MNQPSCNPILRRWYRLILAGLSSLTLLGLLLPIPPVLADTFTATFTIDLTDTNPGDGRCDAFVDNIFPGDQCTLRAAIREANALSGADIIILPTKVYTLTLSGSGENAGDTGDLDILDDLTITGAGAATTIIQSESGWDDRLIDISDPAKVQISDVTLRQGMGGIFNFGVLTLTKSVVISNAGNSGGISNYGTTILLNSMVMSNTATADGGGILNTAGGQLTILDSVVSYNIAGGEGGGIRINSGAVTLTNSTISYNKANSHGGGLRGSASLINVTLINNTADADNNGFGIGGGVSGSITVVNSILAGNKKGNTANDCSAITSQGYNLIQTTSGCTLNGATTGNITGQDPLLGPLQDNGGPTMTHAPLPGSPAIDKGNPAAPGSGGNACPAADQRGVARPIGSRCDIGAVEANISAVFLPLVIKPEN